METVWDHWHSRRGPPICRRSGMRRTWGQGSLLMVNVATVALFWYDKHQAKTGGWRVPERTLQGTAALGGWPAGPLVRRRDWQYVAMEMFHHKTKKQSFRVGYHAATAANVGLASYGLSALGQTQPARAHGRRKRR
ncbi:unnamed protein product [Durusdinium trenchii]|uniref:Uncharacterized protein n=1 Tax=Durusdinium trenchii TaxID=1381693 RepID=A0ABP0H5I4_9DINO